MSNALKKLFELIRGSENINFEAIKLQLEGMLPEEINETHDGLSIIQFAATEQHLDLIDLLLSKGATLAPTVEQMGFLYYLLQKNFSHKVKQWIRNNQTLLKKHDTTCTQAHVDAVLDKKNIDWNDATLHRDLKPFHYAALANVKNSFTTAAHQINEPLSPEDSRTFAFLLVLNQKFAILNKLIKIKPELSIDFTARDNRPHSEFYGINLLWLSLLKIPNKLNTQALFIYLIEKATALDIDFDLSPQNPTSRYHGATLFYLAAKYHRLNFLYYLIAKKTNLAVLNPDLMAANPSLTCKNLLQDNEIYDVIIAQKPKIKVDLNAKCHQDANALWYICPLDTTPHASQCYHLVSCILEHSTQDEPLDFSSRPSSSATQPTLSTFSKWILNRRGALLSFTCSKSSVFHFAEIDLNEQITNAGKTNFYICVQNKEFNLLKYLADHLEVMNIDFNAQIKNMPSSLDNSVSALWMLSNEQKKPEYKEIIAPLILQLLKKQTVLNIDLNNMPTHTSHHAYRTTVLWLFIYHNNTEILEYLLDQLPELTFDLNIASNYQNYPYKKMTPLMLMLYSKAWHKQSALISKIIKRSEPVIDLFAVLPFPSSRSNALSSLAYYCIEKDRVDLLKELIEINCERVPDKKNYLDKLFQKSTSIPTLRGIVFDMQLMAAYTKIFECVTAYEETVDSESFFTAIKPSIVLAVSYFSLRNDLSDCREEERTAIEMSVFNIFGELKILDLPEPIQTQIKALLPRPPIPSLYAYKDNGDFLSIPLKQHLVLLQAAISSKPAFTLLLTNLIMDANSAMSYSSTKEPSDSNERPVKKQRLEGNNLRLFKDSHDLVSTLPKSNAPIQINSSSSGGHPDTEKTLSFISR